MVNFTTFYLSSIYDLCCH